MKQKRVALLIVALLTSASCLFAQENTLYYSIINKGDTVGQMQISQRKSGNDIYYSVASEVTTKMLMTIKVNVQEEAKYHNKKLLTSSSQRTINGRPKANKHTEAHEDYYLVTDDKQTDTLHEKEILYDFSMLYFIEPENIKKVYSNYYQIDLPIQKQNEHSYQVTLPEGGSNTYYYTNGVCSRVDMKSALFNAQMILSK